MGMTAFMIGAMVVSAGAGIAEHEEQEEAQEEAEHAQEQALQQQSTREKAAAAQQQITRDAKLQQIQSQQEAAAVAHGMTLSSGTFNALSTASYNNFAQATKVGNLNLQIDQNDINERIAAGRKELNTEKWGDFFGTIGDVAGIALSGASMMKGKAPSGGSDSFGKDMQGKLNQDTSEMNKTFSSMDDPNWMYNDWLKSSQETF